MQVTRAQKAGSLPARSGRRAVRPVQALFGRKQSSAASAPPAKGAKAQPASAGGKDKRARNLEGSALTQTLNAFDFSAARSRRDAELLYEAKYGERSPDGKMTREQYQALRRKIGGTARDYWKDWVEEDVYDQTWTKPGAAGGSVPYLPLLVGVVLAMLATTVVVVQATAAPVAH